MEAARENGDHSGVSAARETASTGATPPAAEPRALPLVVRRELGAGSTARVDLVVSEREFTALGGQHVAAGAEVARKRLHPALARDPEAVAALRAEAAVSVAARHASLVEVLAEGADQDGPYLLLTYVPGRSLREILQQDGPLPEPLLRATGVQLYGALAALHQAGFAHGDVKPENIRLSQEGRAVLLDLGFARRQAVRGSATPLPGSLPYLSPERAQGAPPSPLADVYALGIVLYELSTGVHPFDEHARATYGREGGRAPLIGRSTGELLRRSLETPGADELLAQIAIGRYEAPSRLVPQLSPFLDALLEDTLRRDPERRPSAEVLSKRCAEGERGAWWIAQLGAAPSVLSAEARAADAHLTPLVGRSEELAQLLAHYQRAASHCSGELVWLCGPDGSGKSRLVSALAERARAQDPAPIYLYARCSDLDGGRPAGALMALLSRWLRLAEDTGPGEREAKLLARSVPPREVRVLLQALDPALADHASGAVHVALAEWLVAASAHHPMIVFLDDLHAAGAATAEALERVIERLPRMRALLVLGLREGDEWNNQAHLARLRARLGDPPERLLPHVLRLRPLALADVQEFVRRVFHHSVPRLRLSQVLMQRSRGSPGLLAELLRGLMARGHATLGPGEEGRLLLHIAPDRLPEPSSIAGSVVGRYKALSSEERLWLGRLSVVGGRIDADFLARAFPPAEPSEVAQILARLARHDWITPVGARYRFARPALREAVYRSLSDERRRRMHAAAARALAPAADEPLRLAEAYQRAWHLRAAGAHRELLAAAQPLLRELSESAQTERLHALSLWALEALEHVPGEHELQRVDLLAHAVDAANRLGQRDHERELLDKLADLSLDAEQSPAQAARAYLLHGRYAAGTGQLGLARGMLRNAVQLARRANDRAQLSEALRRIALVQMLAGELKEARAHADESLALARGEASHALSELALATLDVYENRIERALRRVERVTLRLRGDARLEHPLPLCVAQLLRARIWRSAGRPIRALAAANLALDLAKRAGERRLECEAGSRLGGLLLDLDRTEEAEMALRDALQLAGAIEDRRGEALTRLFLAILLWERDDPESLRAIDRAVELARDIGYWRALSVALAIRARILRADGALTSALELCQGALELLERHGAELVDRIVIRATHALVLSSLGRADEAAEVLEGLEAEVEAQARPIEGATLRVGLQSYARKLLAAAASPDGPVYPRFRGAGTGGSADSGLRPPGGFE
jgi:serine/threonine protein kinase/tetratricopeptide (TPR) repeat protein